MAYAVKEGDRDAPDPWVGYTVTEKKGTISAGRKKKRHVFSREEVKAIVAYASKTRDPNTVDYWGPLFGAFQGLRLEEVSQLRVVDITTEEGVLLILPH
jgi:integrase